MTPSQLTTEQLKEIERLFRQGKKIKHIAQRYDIKPRTLSSFLQKKDLIKQKSEVFKYEMKFRLKANSFDEKREYEKCVNRQINNRLRNIRHIQVHQWSPYYIDKDKYQYTLYFRDNSPEPSFSQSSLLSVLKSAADDLCLSFNM